MNKSEKRFEMKIGLLCGKTLNSFQLEVIKSLFGLSNHDICVCVIDNTPPKTLTQKLIGNLKKGRGGYVLLWLLSYYSRKRNFPKTHNHFF